MLGSIFRVGAMVLFGTIANSLMESISNDPTLNITVALVVGFLAFFGALLITKKFGL